MPLVPASERSYESPKWIPFGCQSVRQPVSRQIRVDGDVGVGLAMRSDAMSVGGAMGQ